MSSGRLLHLISEIFCNHDYANGLFLAKRVRRERTKTRDDATAKLGDLMYKTTLHIYVTVQIFTYNIYLIYKWLFKHVICIVKYSCSSLQTNVTLNPLCLRESSRLFLYHSWRSIYCDGFTKTRLLAIELFYFAHHERSESFRAHSHNTKTKTRLKTQTLILRIQPFHSKRHFRSLIILLKIIL